MDEWPYSQSDHDDAVGTGCLILAVAAIPVLMAVVAAVVCQ